MSAQGVNSALRRKKNTPPPAPVAFQKHGQTFIGMSAFLWRTIPFSFFFDTTSSDRFIFIFV